MFTERAARSVVKGCDMDDQFWIRPYDLSLSAPIFPEQMVLGTGLGLQSAGLADLVDPCSAGLILSHPPGARHLPGRSVQLRRTEAVLDRGHP